ncbi:hypothetical protein SRHO_G00183710 [Serrasalmus rhombeus]
MPCSCQIRSGPSEEEAAGDQAKGTELGDTAHRNERKGAARVEGTGRDIDEGIATEGAREEKIKRSRSCVRIEKEERGG